MQPCLIGEVKDTPSEENSLPVTEEKSREEDAVQLYEIDEDGRLFCEDNPTDELYQLG